MRNIRGYVVERLMTQALMDRHVGFFREAAANAEDEQKKAAILASLADYEVGCTPVGGWFALWKRVHYVEAKQKIVELRRRIPDGVFRIMPAMLVVNERGLVERYEVLEWRARA